MNLHVAYIFCRHLERDPVAAHIFQCCLADLQPRRGPETFDHRPIYRWESPENGLTVSFAESEEVISDNYQLYLPELHRNFAGCDFVGIVNWHEGANAPDRILCLHTTGDVPSGTFGAADPAAFTALFNALRSVAANAGCSYTTLSEATHWSGATDPNNIEQITRFPVPVMDIEIGSSSCAWSDPAAHTALARALVTFPKYLHVQAPAILCLGGVHFETAFSKLLQTQPDAYNLSHILPNHWLRSEQYGGIEGVRRLRSAAASVRGGIRGIAFHDSLKGPIKNAARLAATEVGVPAFSHRILRDPVCLAAALATASATG